MNEYETRLAQSYIICYSKSQKLGNRDFPASMRYHEAICENTETSSFIDIHLVINTTEISTTMSDEEKPINAERQNIFVPNHPKRFFFSAISNIDEERRAKL
jgi:hypothetical protein